LVGIGARILIVTSRAIRHGVEGALARLGIAQALGARRVAGWIALHHSNGVHHTQEIQALECPVAQISIFRHNAVEVRCALASTPLTHAFTQLANIGDGARIAVFTRGPIRSHRGLACAVFRVAFINGARIAVITNNGRSTTASGTVTMVFYRTNIPIFTGSKVETMTATVVFAIIV
jgi:hypothetical protein